MPKTSAKKLLIVESPAKAKTIEKYLDNEYTVRASVGHIRDLPKSSKNAIDMDGFVPHYEISKGKEKVVSDLKALAKGATEVLLATDPDREGEAIAWHIKEAIGLKKPKRVVFHEITKTAVQEALKHPREIDDDLRKAQEARRVLDRLFGYDLSGLIWKKLRYGLSAGRVQSPALRILVEREKEIRAFVPEAYWVISAVFKTVKGTDIPFHCSIEPKTEKEANDIVSKAKQSAWQVGSIDETEALRRARAPFTTSTLQQAASSRLGYSPSVTMGLAQKLYEAGHISYMRTDSTFLSNQALEEIEKTVKAKFGADHYKRQTYSSKSKNAQEAHEAIRPTHFNITAAGRNPQEEKLYQLIWQRAIASQMADAKVLKTKVTATAQDASIPAFATNGSRVLFEGWLKADPRARGEDVDLPKLAIGEKLDLADISHEGKETQPPSRYSEAGLVKELEKRGIGRPSTYASIIKTIQDRDYVAKENKSLRPTETGEVVSDFLSEHFDKYISDDFTAFMEDQLDSIAEGSKDYVKALKEFYDPFKKEVKSKNDIPKITDLGPAPQGTVCPECGNSMIIKLSRGGKFYSCSRFPDCQGALTLDGKKLEGPKELDEMCPKCGKSHLVEREGRFGKFVACGNYPKCKFIKKDETGGKGGPNDTGVECPMCKSGNMVQKRGRFGPFYGCSNYPDCKNIIKTKPTGNACPMCSALMMEGTKTIPERCSNKFCPMHNPHKLAKTEGKE